MDSLRERFPTVLKEAMKAGDKRRVATVRMVTAALKDKDIEARGLGREVGEDEVLALLQKMVKSRQESLTIYEGAGREDLASQEREEIAIIQEFLPAAMDEAQVREAIAAAIAEVGAASPKDMGKVIGALRARYAGRMDFGAVSPMVKAALAG